MRAFLAVLLIVFCLQIVCAAQEAKNILFVGNSLTYWDTRNNPDFPYYNNMLPALQKMIDEQALNIHIDKATYGGASLAMHATYIGTGDQNEIFRRAVQGEVPSTVRKILSKHWDIVVLQEGGAGSVLNEGLKHYCTEPALIYLDSVIKKVNAKTILYQQYAEQHPGNKYVIRNGQKSPKVYCHTVDTFGFFLKPIAFNPDQKIKITGKDTTFCSDSFQNSTEEFKTIQLGYNKLAAIVNADIVEIGLAFEKCKKEYPEINLYYNIDDAHPSLQGSYLIACMFYKYITRQSLDRVKYHGDLDESEAKKIRTLADSIPAANVSK